MMSSKKGSVPFSSSANDFELAELLTTRAAAMTYADLHTLAVQAGDVLDAQGAVIARPSNDNRKSSMKYSDARIAA
jgi:hypothetical protein